MMIVSWSPTGKARGTHFTPQWGDIPAKGWRIHPRPKAVAFCCRGKKSKNREKVMLNLVLNSFQY
jgi:hypothetical protein